MRHKVEETEDDFKQFFTLIPELACIATTDGYFKELNGCWEQLLGYTTEELLAAPLLEYVHPDDVALTVREVKNQLDGRTTHGFINRYRCRDGTCRYLEWEATPAKSGLLYAIARDVTERQRLTEALRLEELRIKTVLKLSEFKGGLEELLDHAVQDMVSFCGSSTGFVCHYSENDQLFTSHAWLRSAHFNQLIELNDTIPLHAAGLWAEPVRQRRAVIVNDYTAQNPLKRGYPLDHIELLRVLAIPVFIDGCIVAVAVVGNKSGEYTESDATQLSLLMGSIWHLIEKRKKEKELHESHERLRLLSAHLESVREEERLKTSREVHDELGQMLTALQFDLYAVKSMIRSPEALGRLSQMEENVRSTIGTVQRIAGELRPKLLDKLGLLAAMSRHSKDFTFRTNITCRIEFPPSLPALAPDCCLAIFRIFQEALTNIQRHADASEVSICITEKSEKIIVTIEDNGKGMHQKSVFSNNAFGLMGMAERASLCHGRLEIFSNPGTGTKIHVEVPIPKRDNCDDHTGHQNT